jgi:hypothetical protein
MAKRRAGPTLIQQSRRVSPQAKARVHQVEGAGKSRVLRPFLGLTTDEIRGISTRLDAGIRRNAGKPT